MDRMKWIVLVLLLLFVVAALVVAVRAGFGPFRGGVAGRGIRRSGAAGNWQVDEPRRRCLRCRGTGWVGGEPERTLHFDGTGFENRHTPAQPCPDCDGTGVAGR
jgi:hypothetical protein